ncbi:hypothetical protein EHI8A_107430 [Entamoeba histolytica HM-1:IMSS-B]|uniref:Uncharacterized protein n=6 Tax=Entamoeba histolytica TaxID=5759 RepID=B1N3V3_ENTH1|nr:hypothetical protein EHI_040670 [Entamoeba histolytica HM-1:IMSS]EMD46102.1 Hypothetical protein EHI5A_079680 [Entamoeba histolytica KU27]EMH75119.1 hypothetical protein EHI8A_107430 [Entamoeba histolytica HM-1:IMSS-B]EMS12182.1 hypothetical protein KM1_150890 [Entamoeba histolytica HM-3:IMSS]ENY62616.1 hypothetical protein EHI7A_046180 [Entamoeba histolytica HM-1:IMSS-A]GAT96755.1 hypothetical protein CL6EHI_040670 [Entamoeba histolytica]|eukprot:XP_001913869.1 hypothetical protein EHI_040670 [Entamoeba histolytica HM-1:IMSS]
MEPSLSTLPLFDAEELTWYVNYFQSDIKKSLCLCNEITKIINPEKESSHQEYMTFIFPEGFQGSIVLNGTECAGSRITVDCKEWTLKQENFNVVDCPLRQLYEILQYTGTIESNLKRLETMNFDVIKNSCDNICTAIDLAIQSLLHPPSLLFPDTPTHTFFQFPHPHMTAEIYIQQAEIILRLFLLDSVDSEHPSETLADGLVLENTEITHKNKVLKAYLLESKYYWIRNEKEIHLESEHLKHLLSILTSLQQVWNVHSHNINQFIN